MNCSCFHRSINWQHKGESGDRIGRCAECSHVVYEYADDGPIICAREQGYPLTKAEKIIHYAAY